MEVTHESINDARISDATASHNVSMVQITAILEPSAFDLPRRRIVLLAFGAQVGEMMQGCRGGRARAPNRRTERVHGGVHLSATPPCLASPHRSKHFRAQRHVDALLQTSWHPSMASKWADVCQRVERCPSILHTYIRTPIFAPSGRPSTQRISLIAWLLHYGI